MMMFQDHYNKIREEEIARQVQDVQSRHPKHQILRTVQNHEFPRDVQDLQHTYAAGQSEKQEQDQLTEAKRDQELPQTINQDQEEHLRSSQGQSQAPMPSDETMRHSIADSLMEILVNMTNPRYRRECLELLEASDPLHARCQILNILQRIDVERSGSSQ